MTWTDPNGQARQVEFLHIDPEFRQGDRECQLAIDGIVSEPFKVHKSTWEAMASRGMIEDYLIRSAQVLITHFGDVRYPERRIHEL